MSDAPAFHLHALLSSILHRHPERGAGLSPETKDKIMTILADHAAAIQEKLKTEREAHRAEIATLTAERDQAQSDMRDADAKLTEILQGFDAPVEAPATTTTATDAATAANTTGPLSTDAIPVAG